MTIYTQTLEHNIAAFLQQLKQERNLQITNKTIITKHSFIATIKFDGQLRDSPNHVFVSNDLQK